MAQVEVSLAQDVHREKPLDRAHLKFENRSGTTRCHLQKTHTHTHLNTHEHTYTFEHQNSHTDTQPETCAKKKKRKERQTQTETDFCVATTLLVAGAHIQAFTEEMRVLCVVCYLLCVCVCVVMRAGQGKRGEERWKQCNKTTEIRTIKNFTG